MANARVELVRGAIDLAALVDEVGQPSIGAIATFLGVVRAEHSPAGHALRALEYTGYEEMALAEMQQVADGVLGEHGLSALRLVHRLGTLRIGEASVAVVASSAHRAAAFEGCRAAIERLKASVPIFKREIWDDQAATWVHGI